MNNIKEILLRKCNNLAIVEIKSNKEAKLLDDIAKLLKSGINIIQLKLNVFDDFSVEICFKIRQLCSIYNALFIIENRADIALITKADGIFLNDSSYNIGCAKKILNEDVIFGSSYKNDNNNKFDYLISETKAKSNKIVFIKENSNIYKKV